MDSLPLELPLAPTTGFDRADLTGLAAVVALGATLSWLTITHPSELPPWLPYNFDWLEFLAATFGLWWYFRGVARTAPPQRPRAWRHVVYVTGIAIIYGVVQTRYEYLALHEFFLNRVQHIFMHHLGPYLIALSWPGAMLYRGMPRPFRRVTESRALRAILSVVQQPLPAGLLFVGLIYLFLIPGVQFEAMLDPRLYALMNWSMIGDGLLFWVLVLDPRPKEQAGVGFGMRMVLPFAVMFPQIALGSYITFGPSGLYRYYELCGRLFPAISAAYDQQIGGIVAWIPAGMMSAIGFVTVLNALRLYEESLPPPEEPEDEPGSTRIVVYASSWTGRR
jgi:putative membrane protein